MSSGDEATLQRIKESIRLVVDFPKPGIKFRDVSTLTQNAELFKESIRILAERYKDQGVNYVAGCDARGFIWGGALAAALGAGFLMIRKAGKLPPEDVLSQDYGKEYGKDVFQLYIGDWPAETGMNGARVVIVDDLLATGGSALAACQLIERAHGVVHEVTCIVGLPLLKGTERLAPRSVYTMVDYEE